MTTTEAPNQHLDERNAAILDNRVEALLEITRPMVGDFAMMPDGAVKRISHIWDFGDGTTSIQTSKGGSFYLGDGYVSFSGGLDPGIDGNRFRDLGYRQHGSCWFFRDDFWGAGRGLDVVAPFRVWRVRD